VYCRHWVRPTDDSTVVRCSSQETTEQWYCHLCTNMNSSVQNVYGQAALAHACLGTTKFQRSRWGTYPRPPNHAVASVFWSFNPCSHWTMHFENSLVHCFKLFLIISAITLFLLHNIPSKLSPRHYYITT